MITRNYNEIRKNTLNFLKSELIKNEQTINELAISIAIFLNISPLTQSEKGFLSEEVSEIIKEEIKKREINVEENKAHKELLNNISPY